jgi:hypothetical protein
MVSIILISAISGFLLFLSTIITTILAAYKLLSEVRTLRRRDVKDFIALINQAALHCDKESANAWRATSFEDCFTKDLLASHIFGRSITWKDYHEIRTFLGTHPNIRITELRNAWPYRDALRKPRIYFRITKQVWWSAFAYRLFSGFMFLFVCSGFTLLFLAIGALYPFETFPGIPKDQLLATGCSTIVLPVVLFFPNLIYCYDGYATLRICKKLKVKPVTFASSP